MDRVAAAELLGVALDAPEPDVRAAFRHAARLAHPDTGGRAGDLDVLTEARDLLLSAPAVDPDQPHRPLSARPGEPVSRSRPVASSSSSPRGAALRVVWGMVVVVGVAVAAAALLLVVLSLTTADQNEPDEIGDCVLVTAEVEVVDCSAFGAQRIVDELSGARTCPSNRESRARARARARARHHAPAPTPTPTPAKGTTQSQRVPPLAQRQTPLSR